ncbi:hypothetical protein RRG08_059377 [Elysia crispata]|uniref:Uncharacterized protein n=1 Tax=Elysia crispata TaxID=231223 RepID=A0AAE1EF85_9GAST|nr:hypothetical protein RRG08_059377 [Elysia crispata]
MRLSLGSPDNARHRRSSQEASMIPGDVMNGGVFPLVNDPQRCIHRDTTPPNRRGGKPVENNKRSKKIRGGGGTRRLDPPERAATTGTSKHCHCL